MTVAVNDTNGNSYNKVVSVPKRCPVEAKPGQDCQSAMADVCKPVPIYDPATGQQIGWSSPCDD